MLSTRQPVPRRDLWMSGPSVMKPRSRDAQRVPVQGDRRGRERARNARYAPAETAPEPTNAQRPPGRRVAAQAAPAEHQVRREGFPGRQGGEEQQGRHAEVVEELERQDLREDAQGGEGGPGVRGRGTPAGHRGWGGGGEGVMGWWAGSCLCGGLGGKTCRRQAERVRTCCLAVWLITDGKGGLTGRNGRVGFGKLLSEKE